MLITNVSAMVSYTIFTEKGYVNLKLHVVVVVCFYSNQKETIDNNGRQNRTKVANRETAIK